MNTFTKRLLRLIRKIFRVPYKLCFGSLVLYLPHDHFLPHYLRKYSYYDRFLPILAANLPPGSLVLDVGANVGDTLISMYSRNLDLKFVCVEPNQDFGRYLIRNSHQIPPSQIHIVNVPISDRPSRVNLIATGGTARVSSRVGKHGAETATIDEIMNKIPEELRESKLSLIKTDTDGHDAQVILSATETIKAHKPIVFMECQVNNQEAIGKYIESFLLLSSIGYTFCLVFDNLGTLVEKLHSFTSLGAKLESSFLRQVNSGFPQYFDILFGTPKDLDLVEKVSLQHIQG